jgi:death-on-curing protein
LQGDPLSVSDAFAVHAAILAAYGGAVGLIDEGRLESAVMRPRMAAHYESAGIYRHAALLIAGVARAHAFVDGNKRTATLLGLLLLRRNGINIAEEPESLSNLIVAVVVAGNLDSATSQLEDWLRAHTEPTGGA